MRQFNMMLLRWDKFYPEKRANEQHFIKCRRFQQIRCAELGCQRTNRRETLHIREDLEDNIIMGKKVKRKRPSEKRKYSSRPGDILDHNSKKVQAGGIPHNGKSVVVNKKSCSIKKVCLLYHPTRRLENQSNCKSYERRRSNLPRTKSKI